MTLRIAQVVGPWLAVPPDGYGGSELVVADLSDGLVDRGHDVTLFAPPTSETKAELHSFYADELGMRAMVEHSMWQIPHLLDAYDRAGEFDVIHDHTFPVGPMIGFGVRSTLVVNTAHGPPRYGDSLSVYEALSRRIRVVAISDSQRRLAPGVAWSGTVHNGIDVASMAYPAVKEDHLLFVGRMCAEKGVDLAVEVALRTGRPLKIAAKMREPDEVSFFEERVRRHLGPAIEYVGEIGAEEKSDLYGAAVATLVPARWDEPFGLVMVESLACGTPVIATRRGAAEEIVDHGRTGFLEPDLDGLCAAVDRIAEIDPAACRAAAEERFDRSRMVADYERLYRELLAVRDGAGATR